MFGLFLFSVSSWFSLGRLYLSKKLFIASKLSILLVYCCLQYSLMILCMSVVSIVISPFSFLISSIWIFSLFFLMSLKCVTVSHVLYWDSWPLKERISIWAQREDLTAQSFLCSKVLLKYNRDRQTFWYTSEGAEIVPSCKFSVRHFVSIMKLLIR